MEEPVMEKINYQIDMIIRRALLITSNQQESDPRKVYTDVRLYELVLEPIRVLCINDCNQSTLFMLNSNIGSLGRCTTLLDPEARHYVCTDCASDDSSRLCEDCFSNSRHVTHNYVYSVQKNQCICHCGDSEAYVNSPPCSKHVIPSDAMNIPDIFVKRFRYIIRHMFKYVELMCDDDSGLNSYVDNWLLLSDHFRQLNLKDKPSGFVSSSENNGHSTNAHKWCLLIFRREDDDPGYTNMCMNFANPPGNKVELMSDFRSMGYVCVKYRDTIENCKASSVQIEKFIKDRLPGSGMYCRVINVYRLYFMKLTGYMIQLIHDKCMRKSIFCDMMSDMVFKETSLPEKFFFNRILWTDIRLRLASLVFLPTLLSRRAMNLVEFYWQNFHRLYREVLMRNTIKTYLFRLSIQILTPKTQFEYLVEKGFLCMILDFVSDSLRKLGLRKGASITNVFRRMDRRAIDPIYSILDHFHEILYYPGNSIKESGQINTELKKMALRFMHLLADFEDMEPIKLRQTNHEDETIPEEACILTCHLHHIIKSYVTMILKSDNVTHFLLREFVTLFKNQMERITGKLSTQKAIEKIIILPDVENKPFSIFNLSQRVFFDILTECVVKRKLSDEFAKTIFEDEVLLMEISQAAITSLSFDVFIKASRLTEPSKHLGFLASMYHCPLTACYLFMQDFNAIQFLISFISPEHFLKYLLFNVCPSIREKEALSQSLSTIVSRPEFEDTLVLPHVLILIYNVLTEMRLVGNMDDPDAYFIKRQGIHMQARGNITNDAYVRDVFQNYEGLLVPTNPYTKSVQSERISCNIPYTSQTHQKREPDSFSSQNFNPGYPFYYLNTVQETQLDFSTLLNFYKIRVPYFELPDVIELRAEFKGMDAFMFSESFLDFLMDCFIKWYKKPEHWQRDSPDSFLFILLILSFILRVSRERSICDSHRERMYDFFGPHPKLENRSLLDIIRREVPNCRNPLVAAMINRVNSLSHLGMRNSQTN
ncbi:E3 ubiquitin-protein ligase UBR1 [Thelohanellus kitauei]|uniref:E3 ubiquitin-protein ligase n=1 Tax=Thelohanellus kitauei TaxID=669202 RepID=A0A0C2I9Q4_THEKT|nr:E3 ubiquitin-protein ligase UBR1 [Thelohanellus kitauei]